MPVLSTRPLMATAARSSGRTPTSAPFLAKWNGVRTKPAITVSFMGVGPLEFSRCPLAGSLYDEYNILNRRSKRRREAGERMRYDSEHKAQTRARVLEE